MIVTKYECFLSVGMDIYTSTPTDCIIRWTTRWSIGCRRQNIWDPERWKYTNIFANLRIASNMIRKISSRKYTLFFCNPRSLIFQGLVNVTIWIMQILLLSNAIHLNALTYILSEYLDMKQIRRIISMMGNNLRRYFDCSYLSMILGHGQYIIEFTVLSYWSKNQYSLPVDKIYFKNCSETLFPTLFTQKRINGEAINLLCPYWWLKLNHFS